MTRCVVTILSEEIVRLLIAVETPSASCKPPWDIGKILVDSLQRAEMCKADPRQRS